MLIFMLHRVLAGVPSDHYYYRRGMAISRTKFCSLLRTIDDHGLPIVTEPEGSPDKAVCLTFDDGYADVGWALEHLLERNASAWVFPVMQYAQEGFSVIDDLAAWIDARDQLRSLAKIPRIRHVVRRLDAARYRRLRQRFLGLAVDRCDPVLFLDELELSGFAARGIRLGVHGVTHRIWPSLGERLIEQEIEPALWWLRGLGEAAPERFCLPHGKAPAVQVLRQLNQLGICFGVDREYEEPGIIRRHWVKESTDIGALFDAYLAV